MRRMLVGMGAVVALVGGAAGLGAQDFPTSNPVLARIWQEGMDHSQVEALSQALMDSLGVFDVPGGCVAAHCLAVDDADTDILAAKGVHVAHCPITYMKLAMPFPTLRARLAAGVDVCLGTDGPASNSDMDLFATMRQTALTDKLRRYGLVDRRS